MSFEVGELKTNHKAILEKHKDGEIGTSRLSYQPRNPPRYAQMEKRKRIIRVGRKIRGSDPTVQIGVISSPFRPFMRRLYFNPRTRSTGEGKVTLVVAPKGIGKTNLTRLYAQAFYRTTKNYPIILFQEKRGDLDFRRRADPETLTNLGIQPIKLPDDCQNYLNPGADFLIPLQELEYTELMDYIGKKMGSAQGDRIIQRIWRSRSGRNNHRDLDMLRRACDASIAEMEERGDTHIETVRTTMDRFIDLIDLDRLIESDERRTMLDYIDPQKINIVDLSRVGDETEKQFIVASTLRMLENHFPESPCFVAVTEAHVYAPMHGQPASSKVLNRIITVLARSYGWNIFLETQSPQNLYTRIVENADEVYVFGYTAKRKRNALIANLQMNLEDIMDIFYFTCRDLGKGDGLYGTINEQNIPYFTVTFLSPVG